MASKYKGKLVKSHAHTYTQGMHDAWQVTVTYCTQCGFRVPEHQLSYALEHGACVLPPLLVSR